MGRVLPNSGGLILSEHAITTEPFILSLALIKPTLDQLVSGPDKYSTENLVTQLR